MPYHWGNVDFRDTLKTSFQDVVKLVVPQWYGIHDWLSIWVRSPRWANQKGALEL